MLSANAGTFAAVASTSRIIINAIEQEVSEEVTLLNVEQEFLLEFFVESLTFLLECQPVYTMLGD